jgi:hypothetical protein
MAWTKFHSIPWVSDSTNGSYHTYLFDTALAGKGWTISAHPDSNAFKRRASYAMTDWNTGTTTTMRFWVNWGSATSASCSWYPDKTFTTTPGDLATYTTSTRTYYAYVSNYQATDSWGFWSTTSKSKALLVTRGKKVVFFWPGMNSYGGYNVTSEANKNYIYPFADTGFKCSGPPQLSGSSGQLSFVCPYVFSGSATYVNTEPNRLYSNFPFIASSPNYTFPYDNSSLLYVEDNSDVKHFIPSTNTSGDWAGSNSYTSYGVVVYDGTNYYLSTQSDMARAALWFNMGTTEPVF